MRRALFRWGNVTVWSYPAMVYIGLTAGIMAGNWAAHGARMDALRVYAATLILAAPALIGGRLLYAVSHWSAYRNNLSRLWRLGDGGAAMYGGLLLVLPVSVPVLAVLGLPAGDYWDVAIFTMLVAMVFGRIGCLMNGCCAGRPSLSWIAMHLPNGKGDWAKRIPTQFLEAAWGILLIGLALLVRHSLPFRGALFLLVTIGYACGRLFLESTREETGKGRFTIHHGISVLLIVCCLGALALRWPE